LASIDHFVFWGFVGFAVSLLVYLIVVPTVYGKKPSLVAIILLFASCMAISDAAKLCWHCVLAASYHTPISLEDGDLYLAIAGCIALIFVSSIPIVSAMVGKDE
jgi:hypothetical protein